MHTADRSDELCQGECRLRQRGRLEYCARGYPQGDEGFVASEKTSEGAAVFMNSSG